MAKRRTGSKSLIKDINRMLILGTIREHGPVSRTELAHLTNLNLSTVSKICDDLHRQNMIFDLGEGESSGGRRPIQLLFNNNLGFLLSVKIEERRLFVAETNLKPSILNIDEIPFNEGSEYPQVLKLLTEHLAGVKNRMDSENKTLMGIGIALSGIVDQNSGERLSSSILNWKNCFVARDIQEKLSVPVFLDNNVNCYALSQHWLGSGKGSRDVLCLTVGDGIGGGLVLNDRLYRGFFGGAGEIGHMIVEADGLKCYCGQQGCLERYASYPAIVKRYKAETGKDADVFLINKLAQAGDTIAEAILEQAGSYMGIALNNLLMGVNPEKIILGGEGLESLKPYVTAMQGRFNRNWFSRSEMPQVPVVFDEPGNRFFILGAALLLLDHLFGAPLYETDNPLL